ncbi:hypothetical protein NFI96_006059 [Prochilodus magdalenae]|nr:hypothetical protein NFI96_006059 [Prochilodus magdalenae]
MTKKGVLIAGGFTSLLQQVKTRIENINRGGCIGSVQWDAAGKLDLNIYQQEDLKSKWPYLFTQRGIYANFELLTDVKVLQVLELSIQECGRAIVEYFGTQLKHRDVQAVVSQGLDRDLTFNVVQLLLVHFGESPDGLMILADVSSTSADIEKKFTLPASPRLILLGCYLCKEEL